MTTQAKNAHTPGPWSVDGEHELCIEARDGNVAVVNLARANPADARLIACAPDLLAALEHLATAADDGNWRESVALVPELEAVIEQAYAEIRKARGEA